MEPSKTPTKVRSPSAPTVPTRSAPGSDIGDDRLLVSPADGRRKLGIGRTMMAELLAMGTIKSVLIRRRRLIPVAELRRIAKQGCA
jgi:hypothetical protein